MLNAVGTFTIQAGANSETRTVKLQDLSSIATNIGLTSSTNISSSTDAQSFC